MGVERRISEKGASMPRPKKKRALTEILKDAGKRKVYDNQGNEITREELLAQNLWEFVNEGSTKLLNTGRVIEASARDWKDASQWMYHHIDGPAKADVNVQIDGASEIEASSIEELQQWVAASLTDEMVASLAGDSPDTTGDDEAEDAAVAGS